MRALAAVALAVMVLAGAAGAWLYGELDAPGPLRAPISLTVPRGGLDTIATALAQEGAIGQPVVFRILAAATAADGPLRAGEFSLPAHASPAQILQILRDGRSVQHRLTIPEGLTAAHVAQLLDAADGLTGSAPIPAEGSIFPDTYTYERGTSREQLLDRARLAMDHALRLVWDARRPGLPLATPAEVLVLASIVERETARPDERPLIAAVFINRLGLGMRLQSDPTVIYAASGGSGVLDHPITRAELDRDDPYNTYRIPGLPLGPICMPGLAALQAVTRPTASDALFFVANGTGGHAFAHTQEEHARNVARWREIERARMAPPPVRTPG